MSQIDSLTGYLQQALSETLETIIFAEPEAYNTESAVPEKLDRYIHVRIESTFPFKSVLHLLLPFEKIAEITAMSAESMDDVPESLVLDTVSELANTISGRWMALSIPGDEEFGLTLPECRFYENGSLPVSETASTRIFSFALEADTCFAILQLAG